MDLDKLINLVTDINFDTGITIFTVLMSYIIFRGKHHLDDKPILSTIIILMLFLSFSSISWLLNLFCVPSFLEDYKEILTSKELKVTLTLVIQISLVLFIPKKWYSFIDKKIIAINTHNIFYHIGHCKSKLSYIRVHLTNGDILLCSNTGKFNKKTPTDYFSIDNNGNVHIYINKIKKKDDPAYKEYKNPVSHIHSNNTYNTYFSLSIPNSQIAYIETGFLET